MNMHRSRPLRDGMRFDVVVVGARAAGAATAMLLARHGLSTLLLDRTRFGSDTLSTHALMRGGVLQLTRWGLIDEVIAAGTPAIRHTTFIYGDDHLRIAIKPAHGVDALYAPRRTVLDPLLARAAVDAGAVVRYGVRVADVVVRDGRVAGVLTVNEDRSVAEIGARMVVGADGIRSTIADRVGARITHAGVHASAVTYGYWSNLDTDGYEWIYRRDAAAGVIPTNDGQACVFASATPDRIGRGGTGLIAQIVAETAPQVAERLWRATPPAGARTWAGHRGFMRQASGPGWALVGDAGYFKDPISAHGLTDALRDADLLARSVVTGFGDAAAEQEALIDYESTRNRLSLPLFHVVDRIASHQWDDAEITSLLKQLSSSMTDEVETLADLDRLPVS